MLDKTHLKRPKDHSSCLNINNNHIKWFFYNTVTTCFDLPRNIIDCIYVLFPLTDWRWPRTTTKSRTINRDVENVSNSETSSYTVCVAIFVHVRRLKQWNSWLLTFLLAASVCFTNVSRTRKDSDTVGHSNVHSSSCRTVKLAVVQKWYHKLIPIVKPIVNP